MATGTGEPFSRTKTVLVLAVVIGCFAVLWPKIFYPMLTASLNPKSMVMDEDGKLLLCIHVYIGKFMKM